MQLSDGRRFETDAIVIAAGIVPNVELAAEAGLAVDNGIVIDSRLVTSDPAISAMGDCAYYPNAYTGTMARLESVQNAVDQARCIAARLTGEDKPYDGLPWFWSNQGSARLQIAGLSNGHDSTVLRGDPESGKFSVFLYQGERLIAVESINSAGDHMLARRLLAACTNVPSCRRRSGREPQGPDVAALWHRAARRSAPGDSHLLPLGEKVAEPKGRSDEGCWKKRDTSELRAKSIGPESGNRFRDESDAKTKEDRAASERTPL